MFARLIITQDFQKKIGYCVQHVIIGVVKHALEQTVAITANDALVNKIRMIHRGKFCFYFDTVIVGLEIPKKDII